MAVRIASACIAMLTLWAISSLPQAGDRVRHDEELCGSGLFSCAARFGTMRPPPDLLLCSGALGCAPADRRDVEAFFARRTRALIRPPS